MNILIIEDNKTYATMLGRFVEDGLKHSYKIVDMLSAGIKEACSADVILLDLNLPDSSGFNTFERLKKNWSEKPIIVVTGESDVALAAKLVFNGARGCVFKNGDSWELIGEILQEVIEDVQRRERFENSMKLLNGALKKLA